MRPLPATAQYNSIFGRSEGSVPLENTGGAGTRDSHWRETTFGNEVMTGYLNNGVNPLSRVTVGSLADLGYVVNYAAADAYTPPAGGRFVGSGSGGGGGAALRAGGSTNIAGFDFGDRANPMATPSSVTGHRSERSAAADWVPTAGRGATEDVMPVSYRGTEVFHGVDLDQWN